MNLKHLFIVFISIFISCSQSDKSFFDNSSEASFDNALSLFVSEKYIRAKSEFEFLIFNNPGSRNAILSQFHYSECLFYLEDYYEAIQQFEKYISISTDSKLITISKFLICKSYFELSLEYDKDQTDTEIAINKCQYFVEEYSNLRNKKIEIHNEMIDLIISSENMIKDLRTKLAKKNLESGNLYIRIEEYDAALKYFNLILSEYYDTPFVDDALYSIVLTNLLNNNKAEAEIFLNLYKNDFEDEKKFQESEKLLNNIKFSNNNYNYIIGILLGSYILQFDLLK